MSNAFLEIIYWGFFFLAKKKKWANDYDTMKHIEKQMSKSSTYHSILIGHCLSDNDFFLLSW